jgi:uncharacterized protein (TIRG00374 family)
MTKQRLVTVAGLIISMVLLYFSLQGIKYQEIITTLQKADYRLLFLPLIFVAIAVTGCSYRWSIVAGEKVKPSQTFPALMIGLFVNNVLPARIGELARGYVLSRKTGLSFAYCLSTVLADRFFDLTGLLAITFLFFPSHSLPPAVSRSIYLLVGLLVVCIILMIVLSRKKLAGIIAGRLHRIQRPFFSGIAKRVLEIQENLNRINSPLNLSGLTLLSMINWLSMSTALYFIALSVGVTISYKYVPFVCALLNMGLTIPSSPGYIGVYQFLLVYLLSIFDVPKSEAFTVSILFHASWYIPYNVLGAILAVKEHVKLREIKDLKKTA